MLLDTSFHYIRTHDHHDILPKSRKNPSTLSYPIPYRPHGSLISDGIPHQQWCKLEKQQQVKGGAKFNRRENKREPVGERGAWMLAEGSQQKAERRLRAAAGRGAVGSGKQ